MPIVPIESWQEWLLLMLAIMLCTFCLGVYVGRVLRSRQ